MEFGYDDDPVDDNTSISSNLNGKNDEEDSIYVCSNIDEDGNNLSILPVRKRQKGGRQLHTVWAHLTLDASPHSNLSSRCRHCNEMVTYHKKSEQAIFHLNHCKAFKAKMQQMLVSDRPPWFVSVSRLKMGTTISSLSSDDRVLVTPSGKCQQLKQSYIEAYACPKLTDPEQIRVNKALALHFYITGTSFQRIEESHLQEAFRICRPDVKVPNRKQLAGPLLDLTYGDMKKRIDSAMTDSQSVVCVTSDAWTNICSDPIVNYMAVSATFTLFIESVATGEQSHSANWIADDISRVLLAFPAVTCGACTDNTSTNKAAWKLLAKKFPSKFFHGCVSHGLNLLVKDIFAATKTKHGNADERRFPLGYPFEHLLNFAEQCKDVVKYFKNHHGVKAQLNHEQNLFKLPKLCSPAPTRWGSILACFVSLLKSERVLLSIVHGRHWLSTGTAEQRAKRSKIHDVITDVAFVQHLNKAIAILLPIDELIVYFQSDRVPVSDVYNAFVHLPDVFKKVDEINTEENEYICNLVQSRFDFMYGHAHGVAYALDPRYLCEGIVIGDDGKDFSDVLEDFIVNFPPNDHDEADEARKVQMSKEYVAFRLFAGAQKREGGRRYKELVEKTISVLDWWQLQGPRRWPLLSEIASKVFNMAASSAASERCFSTFSFVHSQLRNSLQDSKVEKLVYIKSNYNYFRDCNWIADSDDNVSDDAS